MAEQTIVLVNDHEDTVEMLVVSLQAAGFNVEGYTDGHAALRRLVQPPEPCLLIVDFKIGNMSSDELFRHAKAAGVTAPIVIITATPSSHFDAEAARVQGVSHVLFKPFQVEQLDALVKQYGRGGCG